MSGHLRQRGPGDGWTPKGIVANASSPNSQTSGITLVGWIGHGKSIYITEIGKQSELLIFSEICG